MEYIRKLRFTKESLCIFALAFFAFAFGFVLLYIGNTLLGCLSIIIGIIITWVIVKNIKNVKGAKVISYTDGFSVYKTDGTPLCFTWNNLSLAGIVKNGMYKDFLVVYDESIDQFALLPPEFENFEGFLDEIKEKINITEIVLNEDETIKEYLKRTVLKEV